MKKYLFIICALSISLTILPVEFLYPVALSENKQKKSLFLLYQKAPNHIELWVWDPDTKIAHKGLLSRFHPANLKMLPSKNGVSFIDNGRIRLKYFNKNMIHSIDIYEPIYNIQTLEWLSETSCYLSAKENELYGIYILFVDGTLQRLRTDTINHYTYPQIVDNILFYIKQTPIKGSRYLYEIMAAKDTPEQDRAIVHFGIKPIAFLTMLSPKEGFVVQHPAVIEKKDRYLNLKYIHLKKTNGVWTKRTLFKFSIPTQLLFATDTIKLYESILPLLPLHHNNTIIFSSCKNDKVTMDLFIYNLATKDTVQITNAHYPDEYYFKPFIISDNKLLFGGVISCCNALPNTWIKENNIYFDMPEIPL